MSKHADYEDASDVVVEQVVLDRPVRRDIFDRPAAWIDSPRHLSIVELRLASLHLDCRTPAAYAPRVMGLIVGENPGARTHPYLPLFPWPPSSSAGRLVSMSGVTPGQYLGGLYRRNLVDSTSWNASAAERRARCILTALFDADPSLRVVLCGSKVARAFHLPPDPWTPSVLDSRQTCVVIPHPSGLNRMYNSQDARSATRSWIRWAALGESQP